MFACVCDVLLVHNRNCRNNYDFKVKLFNCHDSDDIYSASIPKSHVYKLYIFFSLYPQAIICCSIAPLYVLYVL